MNRTEKNGKTMSKKKDRHNREPTQQSYYWGSGLLMDYFLEKLSECNVLIRLK